MIHRLGCKNLQSKRVSNVAVNKFPRVQSTPLGQSGPSKSDFESKNSQQLDKLLNSLAELRSTAGAEEEDEEEFEDGEWVWWRADDTVNIGLPGAKILSEYKEHPDAKAVQQHSEQDNVRCSEVTVSQQQESCTGQVSRYNLQSGAQSNEANELSSKAVVGWFNNENEQGESVERLSSSNDTNTLKIKASEVGNESNGTSPVRTVKEPLHEHR